MRRSYTTVFFPSGETHTFSSCASHSVTPCGQRNQESLGPDHQGADFLLLPPRHYKYIEVCEHLIGSWNFLGSEINMKTWCSVCGLKTNT